MITDVFHYIISLKDKERKSQELLSATDESVHETAPRTKKEQSSSSIAREKEQSSPSNTRKAGQRREAAKNEVPDMPGIRLDEAEPLFSDQEDLKLPVRLPLVSLVTFTLSILFFCQKAKSTGSLGCLTGLLGL